MPKVVPLLVAALAVPSLTVSVAYRPPVDVEVSRSFEAPASRWSAGNRGLEYRVRGGEPVRAVGPGTVTFAGVIAGSRYVSVLHPDGIKTTYSYLDRIDVAVDQPVQVGDRLGTASDRFQLGARRGGEYFDPQRLFRRHRAHLVPLDSPAARANGLH